MEKNWSAHEDRPGNLTPLTSSFPWTVAFLALVAVALGAYGWFFLQEKEKPAAPQAEPPKAVQEAPKAEPAVRYPLAQPQAEAGTKPLPALESSDSLMADALSSLMGAQPFADMVVPTEVVRRIVATVDNLPRPTAPRRTMPLNPVPGKFAFAGEGEQATIDAANFSRYDPYVRVMESTDSRALVFSYVRAYPLFQRAYEQLGYPGKYFNDRLIEAIDNMLAAPEIDGPVRVVRSKVLYEFADADLEGRSAGQKVLIRMGRDNALRVKAKLREIRAALVAATDRKK